MDQNNPSITGVAQFSGVRDPRPIPQNSLSQGFFWKIEVCVFPQPSRVRTWNLRQSIQHIWKPQKCTRDIWLNFTPRQSYEQAKVWKRGRFWRFSYCIWTFCDYFVNFVHLCRTKTKKNGDKMQSLCHKMREAYHKLHKSFLNASTSPFKPGASVSSGF